MISSDDILLAEVSVAAVGWVLAAWRFRHNGGVPYGLQMIFGLGFAAMAGQSMRHLGFAPDAEAVLLGLVRAIFLLVPWALFLSGPIHGHYEGNG